jgi:hypothetical protein
VVGAYHGSFRTRAVGRHRPLPLFSMPVTFKRRRTPCRTPEMECKRGRLFRRPGASLPNKNGILQKRTKTCSFDLSLFRVFFTLKKWTTPFVQKKHAVQAHNTMFQYITYLTNFIDKRL